jgi:hypothetical protein
MDSPDELWEAILSEEPVRIRRMWLELTDDECVAEIEHLRRMADETGWLPVQKQAAVAALRVIRQQADS